MMRPFLYLVAGVCVVFALALVVNRVAFLATAVHTTGEVVRVTATNDRCGGGRRRPRHDCTRFRAWIAFDVGGHRDQFAVSAGSERGHDQPLSDADYREGQRVPVVHAPDGDPVYEDTTGGVWGTPLMTFFMGLASAFGGWRQREQ